MRVSRHVAIMVGMALILGVVVSLPAAGEDAARLFRKSAILQGEIRLSGTEVIERAGRDDKTFRVERRVVRDEGGKEFTEVTEGPEFLQGHKVICDGRVRYRIMPGRGITMRSPDLGDPKTRRERAEKYTDEALKHLELELAPQTQRVAGRKVFVLTVNEKPGEDGRGSRHRGRGGPPRQRRQLFIDTATFAILENREFGPENRVHRTYFKTVDFAPKIDPAIFEYDPGPRILILPEPMRLPRPMDDGARERLGPAGIPIEGRMLPAGWKRSSRMLLHFGHTPVAHASFRIAAHDDLPAVLYRHQVGAKAYFFDRFFKVDEAGTAPKRLGGQWCAWKNNEVVFVLASAIPHGDLLAGAHHFRQKLR